MSTESVTLYFRDHSSDKVYHTEVIELEDGFGVSFAFGRRGSTLQTGMKTNTPVSLIEAKNIYDKLVRAKTAKGYTPGTNGTPYVSVNTQRNTDILPQLLNSIEENQVDKLLDDPAFYMQQKMDGRRVIIIHTDEKIVGINRKGLTIGLPESIVHSAANLSLSCILDGEAIGDTFHAFDLLEMNGVNLRSSPYSARHEMLTCLLKRQTGNIELVPTFCTAVTKRDAFERLKRVNAEGVVFKNVTALFTPGRPASGGPQLKFKFVTTGSFIVAGVNAGKRSVGLEALSAAGKSVYVGNVTVPANHEIPAVGSVVEVRFLYAFREGCLYQPVMLGVRDDIDTTDCTTAQLKFKPEENDDGE